MRMFGTHHNTTTTTSHSNQNADTSIYMVRYNSMNMCFISQSIDPNQHTFSMCYNSNDVGGCYSSALRYLSFALRAFFFSVVSCFGGLPSPYVESYVVRIRTSGGIPVNTGTPKLVVHRIGIQWKYRYTTNTTYNDIEMFCRLSARCTSLAPPKKPQRVVRNTITATYHHKSRLCNQSIPFSKYE